MCIKGKEIKSINYHKKNMQWIQKCNDFGETRNKRNKTRSKREAEDSIEKAWEGADNKMP